MALAPPNQLWGLGVGGVGGRGKVVLGVRGPGGTRWSLASWPARPSLVSQQKRGHGDQRGRASGYPRPPSGG